MIDSHNKLPSILQFYGEHFARIDEGDIRGWAADFSEDATFVSPSAEVTTAEAIFNAAAEAHEKRARQGVKNRHYQASVHVEDSDNGSTKVKSYVLVVIFDEAGKQPKLLSTVVCDELVYKERWAVKSRKITFDGQ